MGPILVNAAIENYADLFMAEQGILTDTQVRRVEVRDALVNTRATFLSMPKSLIMQLGLTPLCKRRARTTVGDVIVQVYGTARLTIQGRDCIADVAELPIDGPVLIDRVTLALLDFVVDPVGQRLIGNPAHGGEDIIELY